MSYYKKVMQPGETVLYLGSLHWIIFVPSSLTLGAGILGGILLVHDQNDTNLDLSVVRILLIGLDAVIVFYSLVTLFGAVIRDATTEIVVTDRRVIYKRGLIWRHTIEMNMSKIETVDVAQGILGRVLGFGTVLVRGTGAGLEPLSRIAEPLALRSAIMVG